MLWTRSTDRKTIDIVFIFYVDTYVLYTLIDTNPLNMSEFHQDPFIIKMFLKNCIIMLKKVKNCGPAPWSGSTPNFFENLHKQNNVFLLFCILLIDKYAI